MVNGHDVLKKPAVQAELMLFKMIWAHSDKRSYISGLFLRDYLNTQFWYSCFAHILSKAQNKYPYFRYYAKCICLLDPEEHKLWDAGTEEQRIAYALDLEERGGHCDWQKLKNLEAELLREYAKYFPTTRGLIIGIKYHETEIVEIVGNLNSEFFHPTKKPL